MWFKLLVESVLSQTASSEVLMTISPNSTFDRLNVIRRVQILDVWELNTKDLNIWNNGCLYLITYDNCMDLFIGFSH